MEEIFENIFVRVGIWILIVFVVVYALFKWIIPFLVRKLKERKKIRKDRKEYELEENYNNVEITTKTTKFTEMPKQEVKLSENIKELNYVSDDGQGELLLNSKTDELKDVEFESFLREINENKKTVKNEIKNVSPKLKGVILSGVLQDKRF